MAGVDYRPRLHDSGGRLSCTQPRCRLQVRSLAPLTDTDSHAPISETQSLRPAWDVSVARSNARSCHSRTSQPGQFRRAGTTSPETRNRDCATRPVSLSDSSARYSLRGGPLLARPACRTRFRQQRTSRNLRPSEGARRPLRPRGMKLSWSRPTADQERRSLASPLDIRRISHRDVNNRILQPKTDCRCG